MRQRWRRIGAMAVALLGLGVTPATAAPLTPQGSFVTTQGATFVVPFPSGGFGVGGPYGIQNYDANAQPVGAVYGAPQLGGNTITNGVLYGGNVIVFGYQPGGGQGFDEMFDPIGRSFLGAHNIGNPVELGGADAFGGNVYVTDFSNVNLWRSTDGGKTWVAGSLSGENGSANGLFNNDQYTFLDQGNGLQRYLPNGNTPTQISVPGSNGLVGGTKIDAAGNLVVNDQQNVFQCSFDGNGCLKITSTALSGLGYPATLPSGCVLVPSTTGAVYTFAPSGVNCGGTSGGNTPPPGTTPPAGGSNRCLPFKISVRKSADRRAVGDGQQFHWIVYVDNVGLCDSGRIVITDNHPPTTDKSLSGVYDDVSMQRDPGLSASATYHDKQHLAELPSLPDGKTWRFVFPWTARGSSGEDTNVASVIVTDLNGGITQYAAGGRVTLTSVPEQKRDPKVTASGADGTVVQPSPGSAADQPLRKSATAYGLEARPAATSNLSAQLSRLDHVDVAVLAITKRRGAQTASCSWLKNNRAKFKTVKAGARGACDSPVWIRASGGFHWAYRFRKQLPRGRYQLYVRAVNRGGVFEERFSRRLHNLEPFSVG